MKISSDVITDSFYAIECRIEAKKDREFIGMKTQLNSIKEILNYDAKGEDRE